MLNALLLAMAMLTMPGAEMVPASGHPLYAVDARTGCVVSEVQGIAVCDNAIEDTGVILYRMEPGQDPLEWTPFYYLGP